MRFLHIILILLLPAVLQAQITAPGAVRVRYTSYPSAPGVKDPIFIYCNPAGTRLATLIAESPGGTGPFSFIWYRWSDITKSFSDQFKTESGVLSSRAESLTEGGYRVLITDAGSYATSLTAWVFLDKPAVSAGLISPMKHCDYVALKGTAAVDTFYYKDPSSGNRIRLPNGLRFLWSSDPSSSIPYPDLLLNPQTFSPPLVNVTYRLHVTDSFTCSSESSFFYESIHVKADFSPDPVKGEAPLEVTFTNKSIRGSQFTWEYGDDTTAVLTDTLTHTHIYYKPGEYSVKMSLVSELGCEDSLRFEKIIVEPSNINIPNVFTPDGDGYNDWFMVDTRSIRNISVQVFSRSGMKVYGFYGEGEKLKDWTGWDGNVNSSSIKAAPGVYYYIIRAYGWDDIIYDSKEYRGFVYLYR